MAVFTGNGSAAAPSLTFSSDTNLGIFRKTTDQLAITTSGVQRAFFDETGGFAVGGDSASPIGRIVARSQSTTDEPRIIVAASDYFTNFRASYLQFQDSAVAGTTFGVNRANLGALIFQNSVNSLIGNNSGVPLIFGIGGQEAARFDSTSRFLIGTSSAVPQGANTGAGKVQVLGAGSTQQFLGRFSNDEFATVFAFLKSRAVAVRDHVVVAANDTLGQVNYQGSDGTDFINSAFIRGLVDSVGVVAAGSFVVGQRYKIATVGTTDFTLIGSANNTVGTIFTATGVGTGTGTATGEPHTNSVLGRLLFATTPEGLSSPTEALRITHDKVIAYNQFTPVAVNATAALTVINLKTGIITSTSAAATDMTLPTGADTAGGFGSVYTNMTFEWSVINTGPSLVTVLNAASGHTITGSGAVATGTSARFATRCTGTNTFISYRIA
jgi:hypothetical protein